MVIAVSELWRDSKVKFHTCLCFKQKRFAGSNSGCDEIKYRAGVGGKMQDPRNVGVGD